MTDTSYKDYIQFDVMKDIPGVTARAMFGGFGFYKDGIIFGMIANGVLYFKVGESNKAMYEKKGSHPFTYENKGKKYQMSYWQVPEEILENGTELNKWIDASLKVAHK